MIFALTLLLYWFTLCPTVYVGDSGELVACAYVLGVPHPTGYPLYLLLVKLFGTLVPWGGFAVRANLLSALCAAGAAQLVFVSLRRLVGSRWIAAAGALTFALLEPIWSQAVVARTYPLAAVLSALMLWCTVRWIESKQPRWLLWHFLVLGFGLANHPMVLAHVPALAAVWWCHRRELKPGWRHAVLAVVLLLPGLSVYGYLPLCAGEELAFRIPVEEDGRTVMAPVSEFDALVSYLRRDLHHGHRWAAGFQDWLGIVGHHLLLLRELWAGLLLLLLGAAALWKQQRHWILFAALLWTFNLIPLAMHGAWWDIFLYPRYMTISWIGVAVVVGFGGKGFVDWCRKKQRPRLGMAALLVVPACLVAVNFGRCDRSNHTLAEDYVKALCKEIPEGGQFGSAADNSLYPLMYMKYVEGYRTDIKIRNRAQMAGEPDETRPIYSPDAALLFPHLPRQTLGLLGCYRPAGSPPLPLPEFQEPVIAGMDHEIPLDAISSSVIAQIYSDIAGAYWVRGEWARARDNIERIFEFETGRPWGPVKGANLCLTHVRNEVGRAGERRRNGQHDAARLHLDPLHEDLDLARRLMVQAREDADPRSESIRTTLEHIEGWRYLVRFVTNPNTPEAEESIRLGVQKLPHELGWQESYLRGLIFDGRHAQAEQHAQWLRRQLPGSREVEQLIRSVLPE